MLRQCLFSIALLGALVGLTAGEVCFFSKITCSGGVFCCKDRSRPFEEYCCSDCSKGGPGRCAESVFKTIGIIIGVLFLLGIISIIVLLVACGCICANITGRQRYNGRFAFWDHRGNRAQSRPVTTTVAYPPQTTTYQPQVAVYPPQGSAYPQAGPYPPQTGAYPSQPGPYPPQQAPPYAPQSGPYPQPAAPYPQSQNPYPGQSAPYAPSMQTGADKVEDGQVPPSAPLLQDMPPPYPGEKK